MNKKQPPPKGIIIVNTLSISAKQRTYIRDTENYVKCHIFQRECLFVLLSGDILFTIFTLLPTTANCPRGERLNQTLVTMFFSLFFLRCLVASILFGCNVDVMKHWRYALLYKLNPFSRSTTAPTTSAVSIYSKTNDGESRVSIADG